MTAPKKPSSESQSEQTRRSFTDKWTRNPSLVVKQTLDSGSHVQAWILERNGYADLDAARTALSRFKRVLDAGCGNGRVTALLASLAPHARVVGVDQVDPEIARSNASAFGNVAFRRADLTKSLRELGAFDYIYCQEVLHHTTDPEGAFGNLVDILDDSGRIAIYVYGKKAPAREYMDDYVRERIADMPYEEAMAVCRQITELGRRLSQVTQQIEIEEIPSLGIRGGRYTPQRLLYNFFLKCYWNDALSEEENVVINYDWYHPQLCSRHCMEEVLGWFQKRGLKITHAQQDLYGITVHGEKA
jgi:SAM-dependent methyltransferase